MKKNFLITSPIEVHSFKSHFRFFFFFSISLSNFSIQQKEEVFAKFYSSVKHFTPKVGKREEKKGPTNFDFQICLMGMSTLEFAFAHIIHFTFFQPCRDRFWKLIFPKSFLKKEKTSISILIEILNLVGGGKTHIFLVNFRKSPV